MNRTETLNILASKIKPMLRKMIEGEITYYTYENLVQMVRQWVKEIDYEYDAVIGIPRSGLIVASIIATIKGKPLATMLDLDSKYRNGRNKDIKNILIVDDSIRTGITLKTYKDRIEKMQLKNIKWGCLIIDEKQKDIIDYYHKIVNGKRIFEWNIIHSKQYKMGYDLDGIICEDMPHKMTKDEYRQWLKNAKPYLIPDYKIDIIITNRLEEFRNETVEWLKKHKVQYDKLIMWNNIEWDNRRGKYQKNKLDQVLKYKPELFIESNLNQAKYINSHSNIPVICLNEGVMFK